MGIVFLLAKAKILGGLFVGWGIGANDSANVFGPAVATNSIGFRTAVILISIFALLGSMIEGPKLFEEMNFCKQPSASQDVSEKACPPGQSATSNKALAATISASCTIAYLTYLGLPISTSQASIGAFMGMDVATAGIAGVQWAKFLKMLICWVLNPIGAVIVCVILQKILGFLLNRFVRNIITRDRLIKFGLIVFGCYGAYALGANNVVVTTAPYYHAGMFGPVGSKAAFWAATIGGLSIAVGALTYSAKVMMTVGKDITPLSPFHALVAVLSHSIALHFFTQIKVPVSSSQAIVGAVIGIGLVQGTKMINRKTLRNIFIGWLVTPIVPAATSLIFYYALRLTHLV